MYFLTAFFNISLALQDEEFPSYLKSEYFCCQIYRFWIILNLNTSASKYTEFEFFCDNFFRIWILPRSIICNINTSILIYFQEFASHRKQTKCKQSRFILLIILQIINIMFNNYTILKNFIKNHVWPGTERLLKKIWPN